MSLCSINISVGVIQAPFLKIEPKRVAGPAGGYYDQFLVYKNQRDCHLQPVLGFSKEDIGKNEVNSSAVGMLQNNRIDVYSIPNDMTLVPRDNPFIEATKVAMVNPYLVGQFIRSGYSSAETSDFTSFLVQNKRIVMIILSGYLLIITMAFVFLQIARSSGSAFKCLKQVLGRVLFSAGQSTFKVAILLLSFHLFLFILQTLLRSSIKTEKAIINTDDTIDSNSKLIRTSKTMVVNFEEEAILKLAIENSLLAKLAQKRRIVYRAPLSEKKMKELMKERMDSLFFFSSEIYLYFILSALASIAKERGLVVFLKSQIYSESLGRVFYLRRGLDESKKRFIHNSIERSFEQGLVSNWFLKTNEASLAQIMKNVKVYRSLEEYTEDLSNSLHAEIKLENLTKAFIFFFLILACITVWFVITWNLPQTKRRSKRNVRREHQGKIHYVEPEIPLNQMHYELRFANAEKGLPEDLLEDSFQDLSGDQNDQSNQVQSEIQQFQEDSAGVTRLRATSARTATPKTNAVKATRRIRSVLTVAKATIRISGIVRRDNSSHLGQVQSEGM